MSKSRHYFVPRMTRNIEGNERNVGFELEFSGLDVNETCRLIAKVFAGTISVESEFEALVKTSEMDVFTVELDWQFGKNLAKKHGEHSESKESQGLQDSFIQGLTSLAGKIVPVEIVCPPLPLSKLELLDPLIDQLRRAGAKGTGDSPVFAFGVHVNPEIPDASANSLCRYLQAYCIAQDWLIKIHDIDLTRRLTPYVDLYPDKYLHTVLNYDDSIDLDTLIGDYLSHNRTRNRALDMLPLFRYLDEKRIDQSMDDELTNARPTFHYRLPNCEINKEGWYLNESWNIWCVIEYLAGHETLLGKFIEAWQKHHADRLFPGQPPWHDDLTQLRIDLESA
ncbi:MAG: amidoligase family protein [Desulfobacterales bacterium]|nr:amidoligase family protein [Deltaproteobacteria bacterium]NNK94717.1 amidoligase family protein [Desulfobacterales bacterium]